MGPQYLYLDMQNVFAFMKFLSRVTVFFFMFQLTLIQKYSLLSDLRLCCYCPIQEKAHSVLQLKVNVP